MREGAFFVDAPWRHYGPNETIFCPHCGHGIDRTPSQTVAKVRRCPAAPFVLPGSTMPKCHRCGKVAEKNAVPAQQNQQVRASA